MRSLWRYFKGLLGRPDDLYAGLDDDELATVVNVLEQMAVIQSEEAVRIGPR